MVLASSMMWFFYFLVVSLEITTIYGLQKKIVQKKKANSEYGKYLRNHVFKTTQQARDPQHCYSDCLTENKKCKSFNFLINTNICELNSKTAEDSPSDYIVQDYSVYCNNPAFGLDNFEFPRQNVHPPIDVCRSNPCENGGKCIPNSKVAFHCINCSVGYYGKMCEQRVDPCSTNPCQFNGACRSIANGTYKCTCTAVATGENCQTLKLNVRYVLDGKPDVPCYRSYAPRLDAEFSFGFWFKTSQSHAYFFSTIPEIKRSLDRLAVWMIDKTFYVQLKTDQIFSFSFPLSCQFTGNWHYFFGEWIDGKLNVYLDGAKRDAPRDFSGHHYLHWGVTCLGYYNDSGTEHYFNGSLSHLYYYGTVFPFFDLKAYWFVCQPRKSVIFRPTFWYSGVDKIKLDSCHGKVPFNGVTAVQFSSHSEKHWMEHAVDPDEMISLFHLSFWIKSSVAPMPNDYMIVCYGNGGGDCGISITVKTDMTVAIKIGSTILLHDILPIFDNFGHFILLLWRSDNGLTMFFIDDVLHGEWIDTEKGNIISGGRKVMMGGSDVTDQNYRGYILELNLWKTMASPFRRHQMYQYPGNDCGNIAAFKDFVIGSSTNKITYSSSSGFQKAFGLGKSLQFFHGESANVVNKVGPDNQAFTVAVWVNVAQFPADILLSTKFNLFITGARRIRLDLGETFSKEFVRLRANGYQFIAIAIDCVNGTGYTHIKGKIEQFTSSAPIDYNLVNSKTWKVGGVRSALVGVVTQLNIWSYMVPVAGLKALARGGTTVQGCCGPVLTWQTVVTRCPNKDIIRIEDFNITLPSFKTSLERNKFCKSARHNCESKAKLGMVTHTAARKMGCFCLYELSPDGNYQVPYENYIYHDQLLDIN